MRVLIEIQRFEWERARNFRQVACCLSKPWYLIMLSHLIIFLFFFASLFPLYSLAPLCLTLSLSPSPVACFMPRFLRLSVHLCVCVCVCSCECQCVSACVVCVLCSWGPVVCLAASLFNHAVYVLIVSCRVRVNFWY